MHRLASRRQGSTWNPKNGHPDGYLWHHHGTLILKAKNSCRGNKIASLCGFCLSPTAGFVQKYVLPVSCQALTLHSLAAAVSFTVRRECQGGWRRISATYVNTDISKQLCCVCQFAERDGLKYVSNEIFTNKNTKIPKRLPWLLLRRMLR